MTTKEEKPRVLLVGPEEPSEGPRVGDRFVLMREDPERRQVQHLLMVCERLHIGSQHSRFNMPQVLDLPNPLPAPITHERVRPILPARQPLPLSPLHKLLLSLSTLFASEPPAPRPMPSLRAAAYHPPEPVERKPRAERKAIRRRNRKKGQR